MKRFTLRSNTVLYRTPEYAMVEYWQIVDEKGQVYSYSTNLLKQEWLCDKLNKKAMGK
jgi:hypothetical protein